MEYLSLDYLSEISVLAGIFCLLVTVIENLRRTQQRTLKFFLNISGSFVYGAGIPSGVILIGSVFYPDNIYYLLNNDVLMLLCGFIIVFGAFKRLMGYVSQERAVIGETAMAGIR